MMHRRQARGFTLVEAAVVVAIMGIVLAVALPSMSNWLLGRKAFAAAVFYQDGFTLARNTAIAHNSHSRLVLAENAANGKMDWRVDICFPTTAIPCNADTGSWSTAAADAADDPDPAQVFRSIGRSAEAMPGAGDLALGVVPSGATEVYFTPLGWVDTNVGSRVSRVSLAPSLTRANAFAPLAVVLTLAGIASICDPAAPAHDVRGCPP
ncbi:prepilin-type N-terminal cleavage/methylation domain-containing protein [Massilia pinisoli]|uniref:Prepilin-type N-terminal cleavage/methylation domain-containing protein n=1 Tax=Massilia pinisoli TaxID=1772194 RepID=A0ABT1ZLG8_9BURK|nr:prepilin-type N-terminal cleavage/methylation domain-containing protein [Massilia pinisoli]MCS0580754.1 prepilin-type N-terminal cleavage/methylation domain-containing protein [Massilia pinisoli]